MKIDDKKSSQDFNHPSGKRIYCWKKGGSYKIGINGTSHHFGGLTKEQAEGKVQELCNTLLPMY